MDIVVRLLRRLCGWRVRSNEEDGLVQEGRKNKAFSVKSLYQAVERGGDSSFLVKSHLEFSSST